MAEWGGRMGEEALRNGGEKRKREAKGSRWSGVWRSQCPFPPLRTVVGSVTWKLKPAGPGRQGRAGPCGPAHPAETADPRPVTASVTEDGGRRDRSASARASAKSPDCQRQLHHAFSTNTRHTWVPAQPVVVSCDARLTFPVRDGARRGGRASRGRGKRCGSVPDSASLTTAKPGRNPLPLETLDRCSANAGVLPEQQSIPSLAPHSPKRRRRQRQVKAASPPPSEKY